MNVSESTPRNAWLASAMAVLLLLLTSWYPVAGRPAASTLPAADTVIKKKQPSREPAEKVLPPSKPDEPPAPAKKYEYELPDSGDESEFRFRHRHDEDDWEHWAEELEEDLEEMADNLSRGLSKLRFDFDIDFDDDFDIDIDIDEDDLRDLELKSRDLERRMHDKFDDEEREERWKFREQDIERHSEDIARRIEETVERTMENWGASFELKMKDFERKMERWEDELKEFERVLRKELISDGYLREGEKIRELSWDDDGEIEVNGREIRREHREKYRELHRKYFRSRGFRYSE